MNTEIFILHFHCTPVKYEDSDLCMSVPARVHVCNTGRKGRKGGRENEKDRQTTDREIDRQTGNCITKQVSGSQLTKPTCAF